MKAKNVKSKDSYSTKFHKIIEHHKQFVRWSFLAGRTKSNQSFFLQQIRNFKFETCNNGTFLKMDIENTKYFIRKSIIWVIKCKLKPTQPHHNSILEGSRKENCRKHHKFQAIQKYIIYNYKQSWFKLLEHKNWWNLNTRSKLQTN